MEAKVFFQFEIIINDVVSFFRFIWIPMLWVYDNYEYLNSFTAGAVFIRLTFTDVRLWRIKTVLALKLHYSFLILSRHGKKKDRLLHFPPLNWSRYPFRDGVSVLMSPSSWTFLWFSSPWWTFFYYYLAGCIQNIHSQNYSNMTCNYTVKMYARDVTTGDQHPMRLTSIQSHGYIHPCLKSILYKLFFWPWCSTQNVLTLRTLSYFCINHGE